MSEFSTASNEYSAKLASGKATDKMLKTLAWNVDDLSRLSSDGRKMRTEALQTHELAEGTAVVQNLNAPQRLSQLRKKILDFLKGLYWFHRQAATHMKMSPEQHDSKPYALPVQCLPYVSLKHSACRNIVNKLKLIAEIQNESSRYVLFYG